MHLPGRRSTVRSIALVCLVVAGLGACSDDGDDSTEATGASDGSSGGEDTSVFDIGVGDCLTDDVAGDEVEEAPVVPCDQPHASEVYFVHTIEEESFPGTDGMERLVQDHCMPAFERFVGLAYDASVIEVSTLEPTEQSWDQGDRELLCLAVDPAGPVTGSLEGANR